MMKFFATRPALFVAVTTVAMFLARCGHSGRGFQQW
jgi:hypothetical protein